MLVIPTDALLAATACSLTLLALCACAHAELRRAHRRLTRELSESHQQLHESQRLAEIGSWELDLRTRTLNWSHEVFRIFEIDFDKFKASYDAFLALVHPDDRERVNETYRASVDTHTPYDVVHRLLMTDGRIKQVRERGMTYYDCSTGHPLRSIGTVQDITREVVLNEALEHERNLITDLLNAAPIIIMITDPHGRIKYANHFFEDLTGYRSHDAVGREWTTLLRCPLHGSPLRDRFAKIVADGAPDSYVGAIESRTGERFDIEWYHRAIKVGQDDRIGLLCIGLDISERRRLQEANRLSESRLRNVIDALPAWIAVCDPHGRVLDANRAAAEPFNQRAEEMIGSKLWALPWAAVSQERRGRVRLAAQNAARGQAARADFALSVRPGRPLMVRGSISPVRDDKGVVEYLVAFATDITERKLIESELASLNRDLYRQLERLRESEDRFATLFRANPIPTGLRRLHDDTLLDANPAVEKLLGVPRSALVGRRLADLNLYFSPQQRDQVMRRVTRGERLVDHEITLRTASGERRTVLMTVESLSLGGEPCGLYALVDITERLRTENQRKDLEAQLHEARKMEALGAFAGGIVHDFNNLLTIIFGNIEVALREIAPAGPTRRSLELIELATRRGTDLVRRISAFARGQQQTVHLINLAVVVKDICTLLKSSIGDAIEFRVDIGHAPLIVLSHEGQIHQILANLITNAVQALEAERGCVIVSLHARPLAQPLKGRVTPILPGNYVVLSVTDTGPGIDATVQSRIFDPFFTTKHAGLGTGLGLAVVDGIVRSLGGHITLESGARGSTFFIWLPAAPQAAPVPQSASDAGRPSP